MRTKHFALTTALVACIAAQPAVATVSTDEIARQLEQSIAGVAGAHDLAAVRAAWQQATGSGIEKHRRSAVNLLGAELALRAGDTRAALDLAAEAKDKGPERDDADFVAALARENDPVEATKVWQNWLKEHSASPLRAEAQLRLLWCHLRTGKLDDARALRDAMNAQGRSILSDTRFVEADAALHLLAGDPDAVIARLQSSPATVRVLYLRAMAKLRLGAPLEAASALQQVAARAAGTPLGDHAALAKADVFFDSRDYRSAGEEFASVTRNAVDPAVRDEAMLRRAVCLFLDGNLESATGELRTVVAESAFDDVKARAQFMIGELMVEQGLHAEAIVEFNHVLTRHFEHGVAASAQYRVARSLDALGRPRDATGAYQAVVRGHPLAPEAPAAAYLAGAGLLAENRPIEAAPYFQIVVDRYTSSADGDGTVVFASKEHHELTEAALCLLTLSYHRAGDLGRLSGAPHLLLQRMPASRSTWRAWALLLDADALAAMGRHDAARAQITHLQENFPKHPVMAPALQLLAWSHAEQGQLDLALATEQRLLKEFASSIDPAMRAQALLRSAHARFNQRSYGEAASLYEQVLADPHTAGNTVALYQSALCYQRLGQNGDAVDRWTQLVNLSPQDQHAEDAWMRAGDVYFDTAHYGDAERFYRGLLENFPASESAPAAMLRIAQSAYNAGDDARAVELYTELAARFPHSAQARTAEEGTQNALLRLGESEGGTTALAALLERYPDGAFAAEAQLRIAEAMFEQGQFEEAAEEFRRVVSRHPGSPFADRAQFLMGESLAQAGDRDRAQRAYEQFVTFFPQSEFARVVQFRLGSIFFENQEAMRAAVQFLAVLESTVEDEISAAARFNLALCERETGRFAEAVARLEEYRRVSGDDARALDVAIQLGDLHLQEGRVDAAIAEFQRARTLVENEDRAAEFGFRIGDAQEQAGREDEAFATYRRIWRVGRADDPFRLATVARIAALAEAREDWKTARSAWGDLSRNSPDVDLSAAARERAAQLEPFAR